MKLTIWTEEEMQMLRNNMWPPNRSKSSARQKAFKLHIPFYPDGHPDCRARNLTKEQKKAIVDDAVRYGNKSRTAKKFNVSRQYVIDCCKEFGVHLIPSPHERLGEHVEYEGHNYSWKKGSWICTANDIRKSGEYNLSKILWKKYYGIYPDANYDVRYKDGNKYNLKKSNLVLVTKSEAQKIRLKDPANRIKCYAAGCLGLLMNRINEMQNPGLSRERALKAWRTSRATNPDRNKKVWETRKRNAEERGFFFTEQQRKKMSEAHKGKPSGRKGKTHATDR